MTEQEMIEAVEKAKKSGHYVLRKEGEKVPQGMSLTETFVREWDEAAGKEGMGGFSATNKKVAEHWKFRNGNEITRLRIPA